MKPRIAIILLAAMLFSTPSYAYIGPGAGFAFLGSTLVFVAAALLFVATIIFWPLQLFFRALFRRGIPRTARSRRVVIVGLDGLEPSLVDQYMQEGKLPNLSMLAKEGSYSRLKTTLPALSPVAWSTFQTGVNPGAHNIFDFLTRDKRHCLPLLSSTTTEPARKFLKLGKWRFALDKPKIRILRRSQPFWKILGEQGIFSNVLRVPISYPPEPFYGNQLSAMCTPDLRGSQGTFSFFSSEAIGPSGHGDGTAGGECYALEKKGEYWQASVVGPQVEGENLTIPFSLKCGKDEAILSFNNLETCLKVGTYSPWVELEFKKGRKKVYGIARFLLRSISPHVKLYVTPINISPEKPALPIGHPILFPIWLAKRNGPFGTLGLMEDTWGRNEHALDDESFLAQAYLAHDEREKMFFDLLERTKEGLCACVFDASDRIQHMFWRYLDKAHPSPCESDRFAATIPEMYQRMDELVGRVRAKLDPEDTLIILSDHGFSSFRRGVNLNSWLLAEGYLALKSGTEPEGDYFKNVDWSKTRAFAVGLTGMYLNRRGREVQGIVAESEVAQLKAEIGAKLQALRDPQSNAQAIRKVYDSEREYKGLYAKEAPDLIMGYAPGYRVSWESVTGAFEKDIFTDNTKAWSGDHHIDPEIVPGILFSNLKLKAADPAIAEIAPTVLDLFAVPVPKYMEGRVIF
jgi:predicted AlkP superfamily phosphohydrolase/phosphomutase